MRTLFGVEELKYEDIQKYADNFSNESLVTYFQYGSVYRGRIEGKNIIVKIWNRDEDGRNGRGLVHEELLVLCEGNVKGHPKPIGFCDDMRNPAAIVYDFNPMDTVHNLIPKDSFSWSLRIKVALRFALTLRSFHSRKRPFKIRNISAAHILCDGECNPVLYDFSMIAGGFFGNSKWLFDERSGYPGYVDPYFTAQGKCSVKTDVFAYGVVLLGLISKRVFNPNTDTDSDFVYSWAEKEYNCQRKKGNKWLSLVHESLKSHPLFDRRDAHRITQLATRCIKLNPDERPETEEVVEILMSLLVVQKLLKREDFGWN